MAFNTPERGSAPRSPSLVLYLVQVYGWRMAFYVFGASGFLLAAAWYAFYRNDPREHPLVNGAELALLDAAKSVSARQPIPWARILRSSDLWLLSALYFCYGWVFWMYMQWLPTYLSEARHFSKGTLALAASVPYFAAWPANIAGGWLADKLALKWGDVRRGRIAVSVSGFAIAGLGILPGVLLNDPVLAVVCLTIALAGLELTVGVSWALCLDIAGESGGTVTGVMNTLGNLGGTIAAPAIGFLADRSGWTVPFLLSSAMCLIAVVLAICIGRNQTAISKAAV